MRSHDHDHPHCLETEFRARNRWPASACTGCTRVVLGIAIGIASALKACLRCRKRITLLTLLFVRRYPARYWFRIRPEDADAAAVTRISNPVPRTCSQDSEPRWSPGADGAHPRDPDVTVRSIIAQCDIRRDPAPAAKGTFPGWSRGAVAAQLRWLPDPGAADAGERPRAVSYGLERSRTAGWLPLPVEAS